MALARELVSLGLKARTESKLRVRQPLARAILLVAARRGTSPTTVAAEIADALNVKRIETVTSLAGLLDYTVLPNFRALGPKVGKRLPRVKELLAAVDGAAVQAAIDADGHYVLDVDGDAIPLSRRRGADPRVVARGARARAGGRARGRARHHARRRAARARASHARWCGRSTTSARRRASRSRTASASRSRPTATWTRRSSSTATGSRARCWPSS